MKRLLYRITNFSKDNYLIDLEFLSEDVRKIQTQHNLTRIFGMPSQKIKTDIIFNFSESEMGLLNSGTEANKTISLYALAEKINNLFDSKDKAELGARLQKVILKYSATKTEDNDTIQTEGKGTYGKYGTF